MEHGYHLQPTVALREEELREHFAQFGTISRLDLSDRFGHRRSYGFLYFTAEPSVDLCTHSHVISGVRLKVEKSRSKAVGNDRPRDRERDRDRDRDRGYRPRSESPDRRGPAFGRRDDRREDYDRIPGKRGRQEPHTRPPPPPQYNPSQPSFGNQPTISIGGPPPPNVQPVPPTFQQPGDVSAVPATAPAPPAVPPPTAPPVPAVSEALPEMLVGIPFSICPQEYVTDPRTMMLALNQETGIAKLLKK